MKQSLVACLPEDESNVSDIVTVPPAVLLTPPASFSGSSSQFSTSILSSAGASNEAKRKDTKDLGHTEVRVKVNVRLVAGGCGVIALELRVARAPLMDGLKPDIEASQEFRDVPLPPPQCAFAPYSKSTQLHAALRSLLTR